MIFYGTYTLFHGKKERENGGKIRKETEEKKKWKAVKTDVTKLLTEELSAIFSDFANILIPPVIVNASTSRLPQPFSRVDSLFVYIQ